MEMEDKTISYNGCIAQLFFSLLLGAFLILIFKINRQDNALFFHN